MAELTLDQQRALAMARARQRAAQAQAQPPSGVPVDPMLASSANIMQGLTGNFGDEIMAGLMTPVEMGVSALEGKDQGLGILGRAKAAYGRNIERERAILREAQERHPIASTLGQIGGGMVTAGQLTKAGKTLLNVAKPTYPAMIGRGAAEGAAYGGAYGAGAGEGLEDRLGKATEGAALGALTGGALGAAGAKMAQHEARKAIPTPDALKQQANALYQQAEQSGLVVAPQSFGKAVDDIADAARAAGIDKTIHSKAFAALSRLDEAKSAPLRLKDIDVLRRVVGAAAKSNEADERRIASLMIDKLDDYLLNLKPADVQAGNATQAVKAITEARGLWSRMRKGEIIDDLVERAKSSAPNFSGSGMENALRTEFRALAKSPKRLRQFTNEEKAAILRVARGDTITNVLRALGKFAPRGVVSTTLSGGAGYTLGGPLGSAALLGAGEAGRRGATAMTQHNVNRVADLVRSGGNFPPAAQLPGPKNALLELLMMMQGQQAHKVPDLNMVP